MRVTIKKPPMWDDFRSFLQRGNMLELAVGIAVGSAFTAVVRSLVDDLLMPPLGFVLGSLDFSDLFLVLREGEPMGPYSTLAAALDAGAITWRYGRFVSSMVSFVIIALAIFLVVKLVARLMSKGEATVAAPPTTKACPYCVTAIPIAATRCPFCTSNLQEEAQDVRVSRVQ
ncbi:MAG: large conductance mechanosensitive channel protein MscL [Anaerolineae bacterium]